MDELNLAKEKRKSKSIVYRTLQKWKLQKRITEEMLSQKQNESKDDLDVLSTQYANAVKAQEEAQHLATAESLGSTDCPSRSCE